MELVNKYSETTAPVEEAEPPRYVSPLLQFLGGAPRTEPQLIEIPEPTPELARRIKQLEERREQEVDKARDRAYEDDGKLLAMRGIGRPIHSRDLPPEQQAWLAERRREWEAWHAAHGDTWRPDGGELDVGGLP